MSSSRIVDNKVSLEALLSGLKSALPAGVTQLIVAGQAYSVDDVVQQLTEYIGVHQAVADADAARKQALTARAAALPAMTEYESSLATTVRGLYKPTDETLRKFGLETPKARKKLTAEQLVDRAEKNRATRKARGTMGKKQKQAIRGVVAQPQTTPPPPPTVTSVTPATPTSGNADATGNGATQMLHEGLRSAS